MRFSLTNYTIRRQPTDTACGPTCLHSIYNYYGDSIGMDQILDEATSIASGGTLEVFLGIHALIRGYRCRIYTYNLKVFDPTWFSMSKEEMLNRLEARRAHSKSTRLRSAVSGYTEFLRRGGEVVMEDLRPGIIRRYLKRGIPLLAGLSSTYLYQKAREYGPKDDDDDVRGEPQGHFVVICGYNAEEQTVRVADPYYPNPHVENAIYDVPIERAITAILLGIVTYDANLLVIEPVNHRKKVSS